MRMEWDEEPTPPGVWQEIPEGTGLTENGPLHRRLDLLFPFDEATGVTSVPATLVYLEAMIDLVARQGQTLALLRVAVDDSLPLRFFGGDGAALIGKAVARCLRQETRAHDVVGRAEDEMGLAPEFLVICPLLDEHKATALAERLRAAMRTQTGATDPPWLSISIGIATLSLDIPDAAALIARARESLRRAQRNGGDRVWRHTDTLRAIMEQDSDHDPRNQDGR